MVLNLQQHPDLQGLLLLNLEAVWGMKDLSGRIPKGRDPWFVYHSSADAIHSQNYLKKPLPHG